MTFRTVGNNPLKYRWPGITDLNIGEMNPEHECSNSFLLLLLLLRLLLLLLLRLLLLLLPIIILFIFLIFSIFFLLIFLFLFLFFFFFFFFVLSFFFFFFFFFLLLLSSFPAFYFSSLLPSSSSFFFFLFFLFSFSSYFSFCFLLFLLLIFLLFLIFLLLFLFFFFFVFSFFFSSFSFSSVSSTYFSSFLLLLFLLRLRRLFLLLLLWLHYPRWISTSLFAPLHSPLSCANCLQLTISIFLMLCSTSSFIPLLDLNLSRFGCKITWFIFLVFLTSAVCCKCPIHLKFGSTSSAHYNSTLAFGFIWENDFQKFLPANWSTIRIVNLLLSWAIYLFFRYQVDIVKMNLRGLEL